MNPVFRNSNLISGRSSTGHRRMLSENISADSWYSNSCLTAVPGLYFPMRWVSAYLILDLGRNEFMVYQILPQMDKKSVIKTLRKDFELILFRNMDYSKYFTLKDSSLLYHAFPQTQGINYYITDTNCRQLVKMQRASNKKPV